jgi:AMP nucleosidase
MEHNLSLLSEVTLEDLAKVNLPRYTGMPLENFGKYILLCNFKHYMNSFAKHYNVEIYGEDRPMQAATANNITFINFGIGSANAAFIMDALTAIKPKACLFLGKCGSLKEKIHVGDYIVPIGAIRGEGTSNDYMHPLVPSIPALALERAVSHIVKEYKQDYFSGVIYTTNRRMWECDSKFKNNLIEMKATGIDMETATIFTVGFKNDIPTGALLLVSDSPMTPEGIKTESSDKKVTENYGLLQLKIGMDTLKQIINSGESVKHLKNW